VILWLDNTQPTDVQRQRRELAKMRWQAIQPWLLLAGMIAGWMFITNEMWKGLMK